MLPQIRPLSLRTIVIPSGQNVYGADVVRFTADYAASDLYGQCIGFYPLGCVPNVAKEDNSIVILDNQSDIPLKISPRDEQRQGLPAVPECVRVSEKDWLSFLDAMRSEALEESCSDEEDIPDLLFPAPDSGWNKVG